MEKDTMIKALIQYEMDVLDQRDRIVKMRYQVDKGNLEAAVRAAREFAMSNEEIYLKLKSLIYLMQDKRPDNMAERIGTTESFPSELRMLSPGVWKFTLPPLFSVSAKRKIYSEGKHIYYLVLNLLMQYENKGERIPQIDHPLVLFRHHICTDTAMPFDYDNIDSKRAIDAMQGYFFDNDSALDFDLHHTAVADPEESYCEIYVIDQGETGPVINPKIEERLN